MVSKAEERGGVKSAAKKAVDTTRRRRRVDGIETRARILESAQQLFAQNGLADTASKAVAEHAGVDLASINYHFGSRDKLYEEVLREAHRRFFWQEEVASLANSELEPTEKLQALVDAFVGRLSDESGWCQAILAREVLVPSPMLAKIYKAEIAPKVSILLEVLTEITGIPKSEPALLCCLVSIVAPCAMLQVMQLGNTPTQKGIRGIPQSELADHVGRFLRGGLEAAARDYARKSAEKKVERVRKASRGSRFSNANEPAEPRRRTAKGRSVAASQSG